MGRGHSRITIGSSVVLSVIILFYPLSVGSFFEPDIYQFKDRTTYHQYFTQRYIINSLIDNLVICLCFVAWICISFTISRVRWGIVSILGLLLIMGLVIPNSLILQFLSILSLPLILSVYMVHKKTDNKILRPESSLLAVNFFLILFMILALLSIPLSIYSFDDNPFVDIMTLLSRFSPVFMFVLIFLAVIRLTLGQVVVFTDPRLRAALANLKTFNVHDYDIKSSYATAILLFAFVPVSIFIVLIPHLDGGLHAVGEDTTIYSGWIEDLKGSQDTDVFLKLLFTEIQTGDRPLSLLMLYMILPLFNNSPVIAFEIFLPVILAPLLVISIYLLSKEMSRSLLVALLSSFLTTISFQVLIGVYAGFYANWIALILGYVSILFALRFLNTESKKHMIGFSISMLALLLCHSYTWTIFTVFLIIFLLVLRWKKIYCSKSIRALLIIVVCIISFDLVKSFLLDSFSALTRNIAIAESYGLGLLQFSERWTTLVRTVEVFLGGIFSNPIILLLLLYFVILFKFKNVVGYFSMVFLSLGIIPLFFGDKIVQSRVFYDIPFQIPAGVALANIFVSRNGKLTTIAIGVCLIAIAIYTMNNLGISPR